LPAALRRQRVVMAAAARRRHAMPPLRHMPRCMSDGYEVVADAAILPPLSLPLSALTRRRYAARHH